MFNKRPVNRKRRRWPTLKKKPQGDVWGFPPLADDSGGTGKDPRKQAHQLHAQIGAIEDFLARKKEDALTSAQMRRDNIVPPPERRKKARPIQEMAMAERRRYLAERNKTGLRFLILFCVAIAITWWLVGS